MSRLTKRLLFVLAALAVLTALALPKLDLSSSDAASAPARSGGGPLGVDAVVVQPTLLSDRLSTTGTLRADEEVMLAAEASGRITGIFFEEGTRVGANQLLVKINDAELQAQRERTQYRLELAEERLARRERLLDRGGVSQEDYDQVLNEVNVLRSELALTDAQIRKTEVRAPFAGIVGLRYVSAGSYLSPQTRIASLQRLDPIKLDFTVPEKYASRLQVGSDVAFTVANTEVQVEGPRVSPFRATVYAVEPRIDENTRTLRVRARGENPNLMLLPGGFANVRLTVEEIPDALLVPSIAVIPELAGKKVFVLRDGAAQEQPVQTGLRTDSTVQVTRGLAPGDTVLTTGLQRLRGGMAVELAKVE